MSNKHLVVFDIDGTLTDTACMDSQMYVATFMKYLGLKEINDNWEEYRYSTDSGFAVELFEKHANRVPKEEEIQRIKKSFTILLEEKIRSDPSCCRSLLGAETLFQRIKLLEHWDIVIATGCWLDSALLKLKYAELSCRQIPLACGDDHIERHEIIKVALERSKIHYQQKGYNTIVYVGDRLWDYKASQALEIQFIGVGSEFTQNKLVDIPIVENYLSDDFIKHLNHLPG